MTAALAIGVEAGETAVVTRPAPQRPVDMAHLARYTMGDAALEAEILGLFAGQVPQTIERLRTAADSRQWREAAHTLKGSARAVGAWRLAGAAEAAEHLSNAASPGAAEAIAAVAAAFAEVAVFIASGPRSRAA